MHCDTMLHSAPASEGDSDGAGMHPGPSAHRTAATAALRKRAGGHSPGGGRSLADDGGAGHGCGLPGRNSGVNHPRRTLPGAAGVALVLLAAATARSAAVRRVFEPSDMEFEEPGMAELDMEFGLVRGETAYRVSAPDFELDLGLTSNVEFDVDGEFAVAGPDNGEFTFNHTAPDNLWTSAKVGLLDVGDEKSAWSVGVQLGPKLPVANGNRRVGVEGLALVGWRHHQDTWLVFNIGGLLDPEPDPHTPRPAAVEGGIDFSRPLDAAGRWTFDVQLSGVRYFSSDNDQLNITVGVTWSATDRLDVSLSALGGPLAGGDRWGVLVGFTPKARLW